MHDAKRISDLAHVVFLGEPLLELGNTNVFEG